MKSLKSFEGDWKVKNIETKKKVKIKFCEMFENRRTANYFVVLQRLESSNQDF